jgi:hypothetical protein
MTRLYPSQIRYYDENPSLSFRMKKEERERIKLLAERSGKSISQLVREALLGTEKNDTELYEKGFNDGYNKGESEWKVFFYCNVCGEPIYIVPTSDSHIALVDYMKEHGWRHKKCHENKQG